MWWKRLIILAALAGFLMSLFASQLYLEYVTLGYPVSAWQAIVISTPEWLVWLVLLPVILAFTRRFPLDTQHWRANLSVNVMASVGFTVTKLSLQDLLLSVLVPFEPLTVFHDYQNFLIYWAVLSMLYGLRYYDKFQQEQIHASQLEAQLSQAQLQALKAQLHPHFLFNTLHAISSLMHRDVEAAERMLVQLGDLLRMSLDHHQQQLVTLRQEMQFIRCYLAIEQTRFQDRLMVEIDMAEDVLAAQVPTMLLQPLVENAIKHGLSPKIGPGRLQISARRTGQRVRITICDDGIGLPEQFRAGVGLGNTRARLEQLYGGDYRFELESAGGTTLKLNLPYREETA